MDQIHELLERLGLQRVGSHQALHELVGGGATTAKQDCALLIRTLHVVRGEVVFQPFGVDRPFISVAVELLYAAVARCHCESSSPICSNLDTRSTLVLP